MGVRAAEVESGTATGAGWRGLPASLAALITGAELIVGAGLVVGAWLIAGPWLIAGAGLNGGAAPAVLTDAGAGTLATTTLEVVSRGNALGAAGTSESDAPAVAPSPDCDADSACGKIAIAAVRFF